MLYSGIDLHKDNCMITTVNNSMQILCQKRLPNNEITIRSYFQSLGGNHKVVAESTINWYWLKDLCDEIGIEFVLAHSKYLKAISYAKVKTDKVDSETLAILLRMDLIPVAHQIDPSVRGMRDLMRARLRMIQKKTSCCNSIHRQLEKFNCPLPEGARLSDVKIHDELKNPAVPEEYQFQINSYLDQIALFAEQINQLEKSLHPRLIPNDDIQRLLQVPGVGKISAFTIYLETGEIERFPDVKKYHSYCRLVPGAKNSNKSTRHKSGCKDGNAYLKMIYCEAAIKAKTYYQEIKQFHHKKFRKSSKKVANILVAKELARICYFILLRKTEFSTFKGKQLANTKEVRWPLQTSPRL